MKEFNELQVLMDGGNIVFITFPHSIQDKVVNKLTECTKVGSMFTATDHSQGPDYMGEFWGDDMEVKITYRSHKLDKLNCKRIIGWRWFGSV